MTLYGLIGHPLGHSFSQRFFREKFATENTDADYLNFDIETIDALHDIIASHTSLRGLNCTIPHKQAVMALLDDLHPAAAEIGAVNTIRIERTADGQVSRLIGYNTDWIGFTDSIRHLLKPSHRKALILGTGGASKAIVYSLHQMGIETMYVSRNPKSNQLTYADLDENIMREYTIIVNCSPVGMYPHTDNAPEIPYRLLTPDHLLYDLVYNPTETLFMTYGRRYGRCIVKNGLEMLERQALASYAYWNEPC